MGNVVDQLEVNIGASASAVNPEIDNLKDRLITLNDVITTLGNNTSYSQNLANMGMQFQALNSAIGSLGTGNLNTFASSLGKLGGKYATAGINNLPNLASGLNSLSKASSTFPDLSGLATIANSVSVLGNAKSSKAAANISSLATGLSSLSSLSGMSIPDMSWLGSLQSTLHQMGLAKTTKGVENIPKLATALKDLATATQGINVSSNTVAYVDALARLASTGNQAGSAANGVANSLKNFDKQAGKARISTISLIGVIGTLKAAFWALKRIGSFFADAVENASDLVEVQHVVNTVYGEFADQMDRLSASSISNYGMSELTTKQIGSRFQAMGVAMGFARGEMADMSIELTKLAGDMASFYNVDYSEVAKDLEAVFTGQTRPLRQYGVDLTQATLQEYALTQGITKNISSMTQAEKTAIRYSYVMDRLGMVEGDFVKTANTWANQVRMLKENFKALGIVIGKGLINALKPFVKGMNTVLGAVTTFATNVLNALGKIFGWQIEMETSGV